MCVTFGTGNDPRCHTLQSAYVFQDVKEPTHHTPSALRTLCLQQQELYLKKMWLGSRWRFIELNYGVGCLQ